MSSEDVATPSLGDSGLVLEVGGMDETRLLPRVPALTNGEREQAIAVANAAARTRSLVMLANWLPGFDFEAYGQTTDDNRFQVLEIGHELPDFLDGVTAVDETMASISLESPRLTFAHGGRQGHSDAPFPGIVEVRRHRDANIARLDPATLFHCFEQGYTAILNSFDAYERRSAAFCEHLERAIGSEVNINVYVSRHEAAGFGPHWDHHDTVIVPVTGSKHWQIHAPTELAPLLGYNERKVAGDVVWSGELEPGMALVIPRGWGHEVTGNDSVSIHYTIGLNRVRAHHLLQLLTDEAPFYPLFRADLPYDVDSAVKSYERSLFDGPEDFPRETAALLTPELIGRGVANARMRMGPRAFSSFGSSRQALVEKDWSNLEVESPVAAGAMWLGEDEESYSLGLHAKHVRLANETLPMVEQLLTTEPVAASSLPQLSSPELTADFLGDLLRHQFLRISGVR
jgi:hypothetical protein